MNLVVINMRKKLLIRFGLVFISALLIIVSMAIIIPDYISKYEIPDYAIPRFNWKDAVLKLAEYKIHFKMFGIKVKGYNNDSVYIGVEKPGSNLPVVQWYDNDKMDVAATAYWLFCLPKLTLDFINDIGGMEVQLEAYEGAKKLCSETTAGACAKPNTMKVKYGNAFIQSTIYHELGHVIDFGLPSGLEISLFKLLDLDELIKKRNKLFKVEPKYKGENSSKYMLDELHSKGYIDYYATKNHYENFARTFEYCLTTYQFSLQETIKDMAWRQLKKGNLLLWEKMIFIRNLPLLKDFQHFTIPLFLWKENLMECKELGNKNGIVEPGEQILVKINGMGLDYKSNIKVVPKSLTKNLSIIKTDFPKTIEFGKDYPCYFIAMVKYGANKVEPIEIQTYLGNMLIDKKIISIMLDLEKRYVYVSYNGIFHIDGNFNYIVFTPSSVISNITGVQWKENIIAKEPSFSYPVNLSTPMVNKDGMLSLRTVNPKELYKLQLKGLNLEKLSLSPKLWPTEIGSRILDSEYGYIFFSLMEKGTSYIYKLNLYGDIVLLKSIEGKDPILKVSLQNNKLWVRTKIGDGKYLITLLDPDTGNVIDKYIFKNIEELCFEIDETNTYGVWVLYKAKGDKTWLVSYIDMWAKLYMLKKELPIETLSGLGTLPEDGSLIVVGQDKNDKIGTKYDFVKYYPHGIKEGEVLKYIKNRYYNRTVSIYRILQSGEKAFNIRLDYDLAHNYKENIEGSVKALVLPEIETDTILITLCPLSSKITNPKVFRIGSNGFVYDEYIIPVDIQPEYKLYASLLTEWF